MNYKSVVACAAAVGLLAAGPALAAKQSKSAKAEPAVVVSVKPPSGQWEGKPPPADGWVWSAGYYEWKEGRFQWKPGEWILDRAGFDYRQHEWVQKGDKWELKGGDWVKETASK